MKRKSLKYEVYERWNLIFWDECIFCKNEFRRAKVYQLMLHHRSVYSCSNCSNSKEDFIDKFEKRVTLNRPQAPKAPPLRKVYP